VEIWERGKKIRLDGRIFTAPVEMMKRTPISPPQLHRAAIYSPVSYNLRYSIKKKHLTHPLLV
jgi:hypothetical protein